MKLDLSGPQLPLLIISTTLIAAFFPGLSGPFVLDDLANILNNPNLKLQSLDTQQLLLAATSPGDGYPFSRGLAYLSFALNYFSTNFQFDSFTIKTTNLAVHTVNTYLVYLLANLITNPSRQAKAFPIYPLLIALIWGCHPIQVSTVLYAVQRMTLMAGTFTLAGCYFFTQYRLIANPKSIEIFYLFFALVFCLIAGFHCKETAVLLPIYIIAIEILLKPSAKPDQRITHAISALIIFCALVASYFILNDLGDIRKSYTFRNFNLEERLLTELRVLFWYLKIILLPNLSDFSLYLDDFIISKSLFNPFSTFYAATCWAMLIIFALVFNKKNWPLASLTWFLGGHLVESSFIPLEIAFEHRNYLPSLAPLALVFLGLKGILEQQSQNKILKVTVFILLVVVITMMTNLRSIYWSDKKLFIISALKNHPQSGRAQSAAGMYYATWKPLKALHHYGLAASNNPTLIDPLMNQYVILSTSLSLYKIENDDTTQNILYGIKKKWSYRELKKEIVELETEISHRIRTNAFSSQASQAVRRAIICRVNNSIGCASADTLISWVELAIANPKKRPSYKGILLLYKAKLLAYSGKIDESLKLMQAITQANPNSSLFKIELQLLQQAIDINTSVNNTK